MQSVQGSRPRPGCDQEESRSAPLATTADAVPPLAPPVSALLNLRLVEQALRFSHGVSHLQQGCRQTRPRFVGARLVPSGFPRYIRHTWVVMM